MTDANPSLEEAAPTGSTQEQTPKTDPPALTEEMVKSHPLFQKLQSEHSAAERDKNRFKGRLEKVQKGFDEDEEKPAKDPTPQYVTPEQLEAKAWEIANAKDIEVYGDDEYKKDIAEGIRPAKALEYAKLRLQSSPDRARVERQQQMASGSAASVRNLESEDLQGFDPVEAAKWGYSKETWIRQRQLKKERGQL